MRPSPQRHNLARLRLFLHLTQDKLAKVIGSTARTIKAVELEQLKLSPGLAQKISIATGISAEWLIDNDLDAPFVNRAGSPFLIEHYAVARIKQSGPTVYGWTSETRRYPELMMGALGRLSAIFNSLCLTNNNDYQMAKWRLEEFIKELEDSYGETIPSELKKHFSDNGGSLYNGDVYWGILQTQDIIKRLTSSEYMFLTKNDKDTDSEMDELIALVVSMKYNDPQRISGAIESTRIELKYFQEQHINSPEFKERMQKPFDPSNLEEYLRRKEENKLKIKEDKEKIIESNSQIIALAAQIKESEEQIALLRKQIRIYKSQKTAATPPSSPALPIRSRKKKA